MKSLTYCAMFAGISLAVFGQQPNTATASAVFDGINGPAFPISLAVPPVGTLTYSVSGAPNQGYMLVHSPLGVSAGTLFTNFGIVDLNISGGYDVVLDGLFFTGSPALDPLAHTGANGTSTWAVPLSPALAGFLGGFQTVVGDVTSPRGSGSPRRPR